MRLSVLSIGDNEEGMYTQGEVAENSRSQSTSETRNITRRRNSRS